MSQKAANSSTDMFKGTNIGLLFGLIVLVGVAALFLKEREAVAPRREPVPAVVLDSNRLLLKNIGYSTCYSGELKSPLWAHYILDIQTLQTKPSPAPGEYFNDPRIKSVKIDQLVSDGLRWSPLVSPALIGGFYGKEAQAEAFYSSNLTPRDESSNDIPWTALQKSEALEYAQAFGRIEVISGPLFRHPVPMTSFGVAVPYAHFKIILRPDGGVLPFIFPQSPSSDDPSAYLTTVAAIEAAAGFTLVPSLSEEARQNTPSTIW